jgi:hypothetical protein
MTNKFELLKIPWLMSKVNKVKFEQVFVVSMLKI